MFELFIGDNFFNELRTQEQLGYITKHFHRCLGSSIYQKNFYCFLVQSNVQSSTYLYNRIGRFICDMLVKMGNYDDKKFTELKETFRNKLLKPLNNLYEQESIYMAEIVSDEFIFDRKELILSELDNYTLERMKVDTTKYISINKTEIIKVDGNK